MNHSTSWVIRVGVITGVLLSLSFFPSEIRADDELALKELTTQYWRQMDSRDYQGALKSIQRARDLGAKCLPPESTKMSWIISAAALTHMKLRQHVQAKKLLKKSLKMLEHIVGREHLDYAAHLEGLARVHFETHEYEEASRHWHETRFCPLLYFS